MVSLSPSEYAALEARLQPNKPASQGVDREIEGLHKPIMGWCRNQIPNVPYIRARSDQASTIAKGCQDFTIFYRGRVLCIECKRKGGKMSKDQLVWHFLMRAQGFTVHTVTSFEQFLELVK